MGTFPTKMLSNLYHQSFDECNQPVRGEYGLLFKVVLVVRVGRRMSPRKPKLKIRVVMVLGRSNLSAEFSPTERMQHPWKETNTQFPVPGDGLAK